MKIPNFDSLMNIELPPVILTVKEEYIFQEIALEMNDGTVGYYCYDDRDIRKYNSIRDMDGIIDFHNYFEKDDKLTEAVKKHFPNVKQAYFADL